MPYKINTKNEFEQFCCTHLNIINDWIDVAQKEAPAPITSSVDIREGKNKYAPVDHNMYPAGFNNLCQKDLLRCADNFREKFDEIKKNLKKVGILPESHTKNKFYLDHLYTLKSTIEKSQAEVHLFSTDLNLFSEDNSVRVELESFSGHFVVIHRAEVKNGKFISLDPSVNFDFEVIILNNDQSSPLELSWTEIETPILPSPYAGWFLRQKIKHFKHYKLIADRFCAFFDINPELIQAKFSYVENIDFSTKEGLDKIASEVDHLLSDLSKGSSVFVKASQGTYGMGISVVSSGEEIILMNRKGRNKMDVGKGNLKFTSVLIQEGVETIVKYDHAPAEVTIYLVNGKSSGGFMRTNPLRGTQANLNASGMIYQKLCLSEIKQGCDYTIKEAVYSVVARLSVLAASFEMKELSELK